MDGAIFALYVEVGRSEGLSESDFGKKLWDVTYTLGSLTESCPKDVSAGRIAVSSHCLLIPILVFQLLGLDEGAAGYATDEVTAADDVVAACRGSSLLC